MWDSTATDPYYVIGTTDGRWTMTRPPESVNMDTVSSPNIYSNTKAVYGANADVVFCEPVDVPCGTFLLYSSAQNLFSSLQLQLTPERPTIRINGELWAKIKTHTIDLVVLGGQAPVFECDIFNAFFEEGNRNYILRLFNKPNVREKKSVARCDIGRSKFQPSTFLLTKPSPGRENFCEDGIKFVFEDRMNELLVKSSNPPEMFELQEKWFDTGESCSAKSASRNQISSLLKSENIKRGIKRRSEQGKTNYCKKPPYATANLHGSADVRQAITSVKHKLSLKNPDDPEMQKKLFWEDDSNFQNEWLQDIQNQNLVSLTTVQRNDVKPWLEYLKNVDNPSLSRFRCRICFQHYDRLRLDKDKKSGFGEPEGVLKESKKLTSNAITAHIGQRGAQHFKVVSELEKEYLHYLNEKLKDKGKKAEKEDEGKYEATCNLFRTVYFEMKGNLAFLQHPKLVQLQERNGVSLGFHFQSNVWAAIITKSIADDMHDAIVKYLMKSDKPLSLITDGSTDPGNRHYIDLFIQTIEHDKVQVYFYGLIELQQDESAQGMYNKILQRFGKDDITGKLREKIETNLRGIATDGASVNTGIRNGLHKKFRDFAKNQIYGIHCMPHRLHLASKDALLKTTFATTFENIIDQLYSFYNSHGHKRLGHLRALAQRMQETLLNLNKIFKIRWISSEVQALQRVRHNWKLLVIDLDEISADPNFEPNTQNEAIGRGRQLRDVNFLMILNFLSDVLSHFGVVSKMMQSRHAILPEQHDILTTLISKLEKYKIENGPKLSEFLQEVECFFPSIGGYTTKPCSELNFEAAHHIVYKGQIVYKGLAQNPTTQSLNAVDFQNPSIQARNFEQQNPRQETENIGNIQNPFTQGGSPVVDQNQFRETQNPGSSFNAFPRVAHPEQLPNPFTQETEMNQNQILGLQNPRSSNNQFPQAGISNQIIGLQNPGSNNLFPQAGISNQIIGLQNPGSSNNLFPQAGISVPCQKQSRKIQNAGEKRKNQRQEKLEKLKIHVPKLSEFRVELINKLIAHVMVRFPEGDINIFRVFDFKREDFPVNSPEVAEEYELHHLEKVARKFFKEAEIDLVLNQWRIFVRKVLSTPKIKCDILQSDSKTFWAYLLQDTHYMEWETMPLLRNLIEIILSIPVG